MNGYERIRAALEGRKPDKVPIMLHNFMMAAREAGLTMEEFRSNPVAMARAFILAVERYGYDGIMLDVDTVTLAGAAGVPVDFPVDEPARVLRPLLERLEDVSSLAPVDIKLYRPVSIWLEAAALLKEHFHDEIFIRGNCDQCPFTLASMLRGSEPWLTDILDEDKRGLVDTLLEHCSEISLQFIRLMAATGVHMTSNGDSFAGPELISPELYREFALPYEARIVNCSHEYDLPSFLHICGNTGAILKDMIATGADGLELDYKTDTVLAHRIMKDRVVFVGNIDPSGVLALGTPDQVERKTLELLGVFADTPRFILNAGCAIPPVTPPENLRTMIRTARNFSGVKKPV